MYLPENVLFVLNRLNENKYSAYLVGGCVRDSVMGKTPNDYDITTNAFPENILECFSDCKTLTNGIKHGTVGIVLGKDVYEVTTYRIDGEYSDNRHPDKVEFSSKIADDLSRRDFTVNAIACDKNGNTVDPFFGKEDIERKIIKCVGEPDRRFNEDALRILRALRFSSVLDFDIENDTAKSLHRNAHLLKNVSAERINAEFNKLLCGKRAGSVLREYYDVISVFAENLNKDCNIDVVADALDKSEPDLITRLCVFVGGFMDSDNAENFMRMLKYDNETRKNVVAGTSLFHEHFDIDRIAVKKLVRAHGYDICALTNKTQYLLKIKGEQEYMCFMQVLDEIRNNNMCTDVSQLAFGGNDCKNVLGVTGKSIGLLLDVLCDAVIEEKVSNEYEALLEYAEKALETTGRKSDD